MEKRNTFRTQLLLSVQRALLGAVAPNLRQVSCGMEGQVIKLRFVFDGEVSEEDRECAQIMGTEVISDFGEGWDIEEFITRLDYPTPLSKDKEKLALVAYQRKEELQLV